MTFLQIINLIKETALAQPNVNTFVRNFLDLNREDTVYSSVVLQDRDGLRDRISEQDWNTYTFHLGYVDRLTFDESNRDDIFSTGINIINNIVASIRDTWFPDIEVNIIDRFQTFDQRFTASCAGVYVVLAIQVPVSECVDGEQTDMYDKYEATFVENGHYHFVPSGRPIDEIDITVSVPEKVLKRYQGSFDVSPTSGNIFLDPSDIDADGFSEVAIELGVYLNSVTETITSNGSYHYESGDSVIGDAYIDYVDITVSVPEKVLAPESVYYDTNGSYTVRPDYAQGVDGLSEVTIGVDVHPSTSLSETYTTNGTKTITGEFNGGTVNVDVHPSNSLVESITSNGSYHYDGEWSGADITVAVSAAKPEESLVQTISANGSYHYDPTPGSVFSGADITVDVHPSVSLSKTYTTNGTKTITGEFNGGTVKVNVHPSASLSETYTSNGSYNISGEFNGGVVTVAVSAAKPEESLIQTISSNGSYSYLPTTGYVFSDASIAVDVHPSTSLSETYTSNGTYNISGEYNGGQVTVSVPQAPDANVIYYTSSDNNIIVPEYNTGETDITEFGANIVSNVYTNNQGVITFDGPVTIMGGRWRGSSLNNKLTSIRIPSSVMVLNGDTFGLCNKLKLVQIPPFVTKIGTGFTDGGVFYQSGLVAVEIPSNVTEIYDQSFAWCSNLVYVKLPKNLEVIGDYIFEGCTNLKNIDIPNTFTKLGAGMFKGCGLTSIRIPSSVTNISFNPFEGCSYAAAIQVDRNNTVYDSRNGCNGIIETATNKLICGFAVTNIPSSVTSINEGAFRHINTLTSIRIPSSVTSIGYYAFGDCSNLTEVIVDNTIPPVLEGSGDTVFSDNAQGRLIKVPAASLQDYLNAPGWSYYASSIVSQ